MKFTAEQIAGILEGEVVGNPNAEVSQLSKIEEGYEGSLTFLANPKYLNYIYTTKASVTIVNNTFVPDAPLTTTLTGRPLIWLINSASCGLTATTSEGWRSTRCSQRR